MRISACQCSRAAIAAGLLATASRTRASRFDAVSEVGTGVVCALAGATRADAIATRIRITACRFTTSRVSLSIEPPESHWGRRSSALNAEEAVLTCNSRPTPRILADNQQVPLCEPQGRSAIARVVRFAENRAKKESRDLGASPDAGRMDAAKRSPV